MVKFTDIKQVHLELSSYCNARCPGCPRNFYGLKHNSGYKEHNLSLSDIKQIFKNNFVKQLESIRINGNFGDFVMNPASLDIIKWFKEQNHELKINITTNGSAQRSDFWIALGKLGIVVNFAIDGLSGTHEKYRQGTDFDTVIHNASLYINAGGIANCQFINFNHNQNDKAQLQTMLQDIGFKLFNEIPNGRGYMPVFDDIGNKLLDIDYTNQTHLSFSKDASVTELKVLKHNSNVLLDDITQDLNCNCINCEVQESKEIYISSLGDVYPCCYLGFEPKTFETSYHRVANAQFKNKIMNNNAIENNVNDCIKWFDTVEQSWNKETFNDGRLVICQYTCGENNG